LQSQELIERWAAARRAGEVPTARSFQHGATGRRTHSESTSHERAYERAARACPRALGAKETLHPWAQIVGQVRLATTPPQNHWWNAPLDVDTRGWTTRRLRSENLDFGVSFDFVDHELVRTSIGDVGSFPLADSLSVAAFHERFFALLSARGIEASSRTSFSVTVEPPAIA
jgi:Family of unknown function (DUF5996)